MVNFVNIQYSSTCESLNQTKSAQNEANRDNHDSQTRAEALLRESNPRNLDQRFKDGYKNELESSNADESSTSISQDPPKIPVPVRPSFSEEKILEIKNMVDTVAGIVKKNPKDIETSRKVGHLLHLCRQSGLKTEAFTILDHAFSAGEEFEWVPDVTTAAVTLLCDEGRVMEAITFLRSRKLMHIKSGAFEPIIIALILSVRNTELIQIRMFAETIAVRLTSKSYEALLRKYAHEGKEESAERSLLLMHTQGKAEILPSELIKSTFHVIFPGGHEIVPLGSDSSDDTECACPQCGMKVFVSHEFPCMQFERRVNKRMWHVPFCENPNDETQQVSWLCCVPKTSKPMK